MQLLNLLRGFLESRVHRTWRGVQQNTIAPIFQLGLRPGIFGGNLAGVIQQLAPGNFQKLVQLRFVIQSRIVIGLRSSA